MELNNFLQSFLEELGVSDKTLKKIKNLIKEDYNYDYNTTKVEFSLNPTDEEIDKGTVDNKALNINIMSDKYDDGNVIFIDCDLAE